MSETLIEQMARAIMEARDPTLSGGSGCKVQDWYRESQENPHVAQALAQASAAGMVVSKWMLDNGLH